VVDSVSASSPGTAVSAAGQVRELVHRRTVFDGWRSVTIGIYMALAGYGVLVGIPVISTAWVSLLGFTEVQVGRVAGADLGGFSLGAVIASAFVARINRRLLVLGAAAVAIAANLLCMAMTSYEETLALRFLAGIGSGRWPSPPWPATPGPRGPSTCCCSRSHFPRAASCTCCRSCR
jgi:MFS family permease